MRLMKISILISKNKSFRFFFVQYKNIHASMDTDVDAVETLHATSLTVFAGITESGPGPRCVLHVIFLAN